MDGMNIWDRFEALEHVTPVVSALPAFSLPGSGTHFLAKGIAGEPVLLLKVQKRRVPRIPLGLLHVQVEFEVECAILDKEAADGLVTATFCRVICDPTAPGLHPLFIHALAGAVERLPNNLTPGEVDGFFDDAIELFRSFSSPAKSSVLGLWGELIVIAASPYRDAFVTAWHVTPEQPLDFSFPSAHLEVKTTTRQNRNHEFSLSQLRGNKMPAFIASIVAEQSDAGESVFDLACFIQESLTATNQEKLWRLIAQSVGSEAEGAGDFRYLRIAALNSLRFYDAATIPAPEIPESATHCISRVRFSVDIDCAVNLHELDSNEVWRQLGELVFPT